MEKGLLKRQEGLSSKAQSDGLALNKMRDPFAAVEEWRGKQWASMRQGRVWMWAYLQEMPEH